MLRALVAGDEPQLVLQRHRLGLVDVGTGELRIATGEFDAPLVYPVWTDDAAGIIFNALEDRRLWHCETSTTTLRPIDFPVSAPAPLLDISRLL